MNQTVRLITYSLNSFPLISLRGKLSCTISLMNTLLEATQVLFLLFHLKNLKDTEDILPNLIYRNRIGNIFYSIDTVRLDLPPDRIKVKPILLIKQYVIVNSVTEILTILTKYLLSSNQISNV